MSDFALTNLYMLAWLTFLVLVVIAGRLQAIVEALRKEPPK